MSRSTQKKPKTITDRKYVFTFGKYKGLDLEEVLEIDPQYVLYCQEKIDWFDLDHKLLDEAESGSQDAFDIINEIYSDPSDNAGHIRD